MTESADRSPVRAAVDSADVLRTFIERFSAGIYTCGEPRMPVRVMITMLCAQTQTVTSRQLAAALDVSPAAISAAVNYLLHTGLIVRTPVPGSRQVHYGLPPEGIFAAVFRQYVVGPDLAAIAEDGIEVIGGPGTPGGQRLADFAERVRFLDEEMSGIWQRWSAHQAAKHGGAGVEVPPADPTC